MREAMHPATPTTHPRSEMSWNRVPEITMWFWIIKVLATTVGETAADYLNETLGLGLATTTWVMGALLLVALAAQFSRRRYRAVPYWLSVVLISIVGTLITDNLTDNLGVGLWTSTISFSVALAATFAVWFAAERTFSIHTIVTRRREAFYWLAVLMTFALGTAGGDLVAEQIGLGYATSVAVFAGVIAFVVFLRVALRLDAILAFWLAYILTRPLGASIGDLLSQARADGGLGFGTVVTSGLFLAAIMVCVAYLAVSRIDQSADGRRVRDLP